VIIVRLRLLPAATIAAALAVSTAAAPVPAASQPQADGATCVALFKQFDLLQSMYPNNRQRYSGRSAQPPVETQAQLVRNAGCITLTRELAPMATVKPHPIADSGPAITPTQLHAGVVTNMEDDANVRAFFAANGIQSKSVGSAPLGRRIYVGPFATQGGLDAARDLAVRAGFASPYPAHF
jgi:hypothetical protein